MSPSTSPPPSREDGNIEEKTDNKALEKPESEDDTIAAAEDQPIETPAPPPMTYPKGIQLIGIMSSLVVTIGMMSLDSVSFDSPAS